MRNLFGATALLTIALLAAGCKKADPIVGKWTTSAGSGSLTMEFKPENTFTMDIGIMGQSIQLLGDYKVEGEKLTLSPKDVKSPTATAAQLQGAKSQLAGKTQEMTVKFPAEDQMSLAPAGGKGGSMMGAGSTFTRVKS